MNPNTLYGSIGCCEALASVLLWACKAAFIVPPKVKWNQNKGPLRQNVLGWGSPSNHEVWRLALKDLRPISHLKNINKGPLRQNVHGWGSPSNHEVWRLALKDLRPISHLKNIYYNQHPNYKKQLIDDNGGIQWGTWSIKKHSVLFMTSWKSSGEKLHL